MAPTPDVVPDVAAKPKDVKPAEPPVVAPIDPVQELFAPSKPFFGPQSELAKVLPADLLFLGVVDKPAELLRRLGYDAIWKERLDWFELASAAITVVTGYNFVELENFKQVGVDISGPASLFLAADSQYILGVSCTLTDSVALVGWLKRLAEKEKEDVHETAAGGWTVLEMDAGRLVFLVKPTLAILLLPGGSESQRMEAHKRFTTVTEATSLASHKAIWEAATAMDFGKDVFGYANGKAVGEAEKRRMEFIWKTESGRFSDPVELPAPDGETKEQAEERKAEAAKFAEEKKEWMERSKKRFEKEYGIFMETIGSTVWVAGADVGEKGIFVKAKTLLGQPSLLSRILVSGKAVPDLFKLIPDKTMAAWSMRLDPAKVQFIIGRIAQSDHDSWDEILAQLSYDLGVDAPRMLASIGNEVVFTLWGEADFGIPDVDDMLAPLRGSVTLKLSDPAYVDAALKARFSLLPADAPVKWDEPSKRWVLSLAGHPFYLNVQGEWLVITTEKELDLTKAPKTLAPAVEKDPFPAARTFLAFEDASLFWMTDLGPLFSLAFASVIGLGDRSMEDTWIDDRLGGTEPKLKASQEARRAEFEKNLATLRTTREKVKSDSQKATQEVFRRVAGAVKDFGYLGLAGRPAPDGWEWFAVYLAPKQGTASVLVRAVLEIALAGKKFEEAMLNQWGQQSAIYKLLNELEPLVDKPAPVLPPGAYERVEELPVKPAEKNQGSASSPEKAQKPDAAEMNGAASMVEPIRKAAPEDTSAPEKVETK